MINPVVKITVGGPIPQPTLQRRVVYTLPLIVAKFFDVFLMGFYAYVKVTFAACYKDVTILE